MRGVCAFASYKDHVRFFVWNWQDQKSGIVIFAGPSAMKVADVNHSSTFEVLQGAARELDSVKYYKGSTPPVKVRMSTPPGDIPSRNVKHPEALQSGHEIGKTDYTNVVGRVFSVSSIRSKTIGERSIRFRSVCVQTFHSSVQGLEQFAWVDIEESCKFYNKLDGLTKGAPVLISEVKTKTYQGSSGIRLQLSMTMYSQVIPTRAPEAADDIGVQSEEIFKAFKEAGDSPPRRRALKRLLSEAENASTPTKVRRELDRLKVPGACSGSDDPTASVDVREADDDVTALRDVHDADDEDQNSE